MPPRWVVVLFASIVATIARAEPRTTETVIVRKAGNAKARSVGKLPANTAVTIEREAGEWIRIRARVGRKRIVGFVARASITDDAPPPAPVAEDDSEDGFAPPATNVPHKTTETVVVRKKPGEKQAAAGTLAPDTIVVVEGERGRWLRVRAGALLGYLPRTAITGVEVATDTTALATQPAPPSEPARKWRKPELAGSALAIEATSATSLRSEAAPEAAVIAEIARGARLVVIDASGTGGFVRVRDGAGREGWVARAHVGNGAASAALGATAGAPSTTVSAAARPAPSPLPSRRLAVRIGAGVGYRVLGMDFTSNGSGGLANYVATADASAADLDLDIALHRARIVIGFDAQVGVSRSSPGLDYPGPTGPPGDIAFSTVDIDAGLRVGVRARSMFVLCARIGAHYDAFVTRDIENAGMLPRERLLGSTLGARVEVAPPGSPVSATLHVDALLLGDRRQTPGLEDGASSTARAVWAGVTARYALARRLSLQATYDFGRSTTEWSGMSVRDPGVTSARRVDSTQLVQLGLSIEL